MISLTTEPIEFFVYVKLLKAPSVILGYFIFKLEFGASWVLGYFSVLPFPNIDS